MKLIIVGGGISGLSAGIYAQQSGIEATIFESHSIAGGNSTSWRRNGYLFEGGLHWLVGSSDSTPLNELWREVGALQENNPIHNRDPFITYVGKNGSAELYRDTKRLEESLIAMSPQDEKIIRSFSKSIAAVSKVSMPITDIKGVKVKKKHKMSLSMMLSMIGSMKTMAKLSQLSVGEYISQFKDARLRELLSTVVGSEEFSANSLTFTLGGLAANDCGYPKGGSLRMAQNMADTFKKLGGKLVLNSCVDKVNITNAKADGVWSGGKLYKSDAVIVTQDTVSAVDRLFEVPLKEAWIDELKKNVSPINCTFMSLGIAADLSHIPANAIFPLEKAFTYGGVSHKSISVNNYAGFEGYAPQGCTSLTIILMEDTYDEWKARKADGTYEQKKHELAELIIDRLTSVIPQIAGKVDVWDIATPLTYERYCGTYRGSWMSIMKPGKQRMQYPAKSESIKGLYFAGQRMLVPGGLPVALTSGREAVQYVCLDQDIVFQGKL